MFIGTAGTYFELSRIIYLIDIVCMIYIFNILINKLKILKFNEYLKDPINKNKNYSNSEKTYKFSSILDLFPLLLINLFRKGVRNILQSLLP